MSWGAPVAQLLDRVSHACKLCPHCSGPGLFRPVALRVIPFSRSLFPLALCLPCPSNKAMKRSKKEMIKQPVLIPSGPGMTL